MNVQPKGDIVAYVTANPVVVLTDEARYSEFYRQVKAELDAHIPDITTTKGRSEIASLAYKVTRSKTAIDAAGKKLNEDARKQINAVDAQRRKIREELDALAADVRKPLTEWEEAEKKRQATVSSAFAELHAVIQMPAPAGASSECIRDRIEELEAERFDPAVFADQLIDIEALHARALAAVRAAYDRQSQYEADQAELSHLRAEQEERERVEREAQERAEAEQRERDRLQREETERKAREDEIARRAREDEQRTAQEAIARAEREASEVRERAEKAERDRNEAEQRMRDEEAARAADREHRAQVMGEAKAALMQIGTGEATAKKIVLAIVAGEIPHVTLKF